MNNNYIKTYATRDIELIVRYSSCVWSWFGVVCVRMSDIICYLCGVLCFTYAITQYDNNIIRECVPYPKFNTNLKHETFLSVWPFEHWPTPPTLHLYAHHNTHPTHYLRIELPNTKNPTHTKKTCLPVWTYSLPLLFVLVIVIKTGEQRDTRANR